MTQETARRGRRSRDKINTETRRHEGPSVPAGRFGRRRHRASVRFDLDSYPSCPRAFVLILSRALRPPEPEGARDVGRELRVLQGRRQAGRLQAAVLGLARQRLQPSAVLPDIRQWLRRSHVVLDRRGSRQRHYRGSRRWFHRKRGRVLAGESHTTRITGHILVGGSRFSVPVHGSQVLGSQPNRRTENQRTRTNLRTREPENLSVRAISLDRHPPSRDHHALHRSNGGDVGCRIVSKHDDVCLKARAQAPQLVALVEEGRRR